MNVEGDPGSFITVTTVFAISILTVIAAVRYARQRETDEIKKDIHKGFQSARRKFASEFESTLSIARARDGELNKYDGDYCD